MDTGLPPRGCGQKPSQPYYSYFPFSVSLPHVSSPITQHTHAHAPGDVAVGSSPKSPRYQQNKEAHKSHVFSNGLKLKNSFSLFLEHFWENPGQSVAPEIAIVAPTSKNTSHWTSYCHGIVMGRGCECFTCYYLRPNTTLCFANCVYGCCRPIRLLCDTLLM